MPEHIIPRTYEGLRGFSTDSKYTRPAYVAETAVNVMRNPDGTFGPRRGYQIQSYSEGGLGLGRMENIDGETEILTIGSDGNLYKRVEGSLTIAFSGDDYKDYLTYEIYVDTSVSSDSESCDFTTYGLVDPAAQITDSINFLLERKRVEVFDQALGKGYGISSPYSIAQLVLLLEAVSGVSVTVSGDDTKPAAFLPLCEKSNIANGKSATLYWYYWEPVNRTVSSTFSGLASSITSPSFEIASMAAYGKVLYIANKNDEVQKYDGQTVYRAGMPQGSTPSATDSGIAGSPNGTYRYYITYEQTDHAGTLVEGRLSEASDDVTVSSKKIHVTLTNLLAGSGWNTNGAVIDGSQVSVNTLNVLSASNTMRVGDQAFFVDSSGAQQTRNVTDVGASFIVIDGSPVSVTSGSAISNNLKINLWRNENTGTTPKLVTTLANNSASSTQSYVDDIADGDLGRDYNEPSRQPDPPPKCAYVFPYQNLLVFGGDPDNEDTVWFSEAGLPEYVDSAFNNFVVPSNDDEVTGIGQAGASLIIGKNRSLYCISGELDTAQFTVTPVAPGSNIGVVAHQSMQSVGGLLYFCDVTGVYSMSETQIFPTDNLGAPIPLSKTIDAVFNARSVAPNKRFQLKRSVAINYTPNTQYCLFVPCENNPDEDDSYRVANLNSRVLVFDYRSKDWFEWTGINGAGGMITLENDLYFASRSLSGSSAVVSSFCKQNRNYSVIDQVDHVMPIRVTLGFSWESLGQPRVRKQWIRMALLFDQLDEKDDENELSLCFKSFADYNNLPSTKATIGLASQADSWSSTPWAFVPYDGYRDGFVYIPFKQGGVAKAIRFELKTNKMNTTFKLQGFQYEIASIFSKAMLR